MGKRGPHVTEKQKRERVRKLCRLLRQQKYGKLGPSFTDLCAAMGFSGPTVRKIAREAGIDLRPE